MAVRELPVLVADAGPVDAPLTVLLHGHLDVVPGHEEQFAPRVDGDRLFGRGAYDMKGGLAALMLAIADLQQVEGVRARLGIVPDEESEEEVERGCDLLLDAGFVGDFAITGEPTDMLIGVAAKGVLAMRIRVPGLRRARRHAVAGRKRDPARDRGLPPDRVATVCRGELRALRPAIHQSRPDPRRRRPQQGARRLRDRR